MSRSGYSDECENVALWRQAVENALTGKRGQSFLRDLVVQLNAMPVKQLVRNSFREDGSFCALGVLGNARGIDLTEFDVDPDDINHDELGRAFGIAPSLAQEVMYLNDDDDAQVFYRRAAETPEHRWERMRAWAVSHLSPAPGGPRE